MSLKNIPTNWCVSTIGDINNYNSLTFNPKSFQEDTFELYSVPSFASGSPEVLLGKDIASNKQYIKFKDILLCKINPRINRVWCVKENTEFPQIGSSEWIVIRQPLIHEGFLTYFLQTQSFRDLLCSDVSGVGGSLTRAQPKRVATYHVPIAPFQEQKIIAEKLDTLLAQVDSTKARLELIPQILKRFRQAVLSAATSGRLISETDISLSRSKWDNVKLIEVIQTKPRNGYSPKGVDYSTDVKNLTLSATTKGYFNEKCFKYVDVIIPGDSHLWLKNGDFLIQRANSLEYVGVSALYEGKDDQFIYPDLMMKFRANNKIHPKYLYYSLQTEKARKYFRDNATGTTGNMPKINQSVVSNTPINLPPLPEQHEIVRRVEQLFAWADTIEKQVNNALTRVNSLTQSILAKAFRGELTAQWRAENPDLISGKNSAAALLEKIKAERAASGGKKTSRKKA
ncbi:restriction endonuclease subunit S [Salmonella enterica]|uniref:restriction endonuclease subunit S n=1 Tax=Salmonella enterica TaxID=28901 RepID=UPI00197EA887|nr:restriction endonuclease subunit S [Salmonella enterica]MBN6379825.1 restriction endonuclease subunit S [Salmonella enterica]MBN6428114.1 restriction endonuclease subunit S [Salmonella enterica]MBN6431707.1 restriction endonuclease subunit S [Salmonella enterica]MBN6436142.1 restriction endonuclease subunit S [Salmonella enterica]MBN6441351.1 restriction endonuclease subunit S [Salmonella enterica]